MKNERELFEEYLFSTDKFKFRNKVFLFMLDENGEYEDEPVLEHWNTWQASASREGYKLVPYNPTEEMYLAGTHELTQIDFTDLHDDDSVSIYKAMIGAVE